MVLNDERIDKNLHKLFDFSKSDTTEEEVRKQINPNSIDLTLDRHIMYPCNTHTVTYGDDMSMYWKYEYYNSDYLVLKPDSYILACTREYVVMPNDICGQLFTKSTLGRMFVNHMMAGVIDAGFEGKITLELKNDSKNTVRIPFGSRIVQMVYSQLIEPAKIPYYMKLNKYCFAEKCEPPMKDISYG